MRPDAPTDRGPAALRRFRTRRCATSRCSRRFFHNGGFFKILEDAVDFYVTRDTDRARWFPRRREVDDLPPKYHATSTRPRSRTTAQPGDAPALNNPEIDDLVAFLRTLTDE